MDIDDGLITVSKAASIWQMEKICSSEAYKLAIPLPEIAGYKWGWIRFALGGYLQNFTRLTPEKDDGNLNSAIDKGWLPVVKSPHERLPLNKAGYVTAGDLVLCIKKVEDGVPEIEYLVREEKLMTHDEIQKLIEEKGEIELTRDELSPARFGEWYIKCNQEDCGGRLLRKETDLEKMIATDKCSKCGKEIEFAIQRKPELIG